MKAIKKMQQLKVEIMALEKDSVVIDACLKNKLREKIITLSPFVPFITGISVGLMSQFNLVKPMALRLLKFNIMQLAKGM